MSDEQLKGLDDVRSNNVKRCARCGIPITPDNDSGWEAFVDEGQHTQPICAWCEVAGNDEDAKDDGER